MDFRKEICVLPILFVGFWSAHFYCPLDCIHSKKPGRDKAFQPIAILVKWHGAAYMAFLTFKLKLDLMTLDEGIARFADSARVFCQWAEGPSSTAEVEAATARRYLARLYALALDLPVTDSEDVDSSEISSEAWKAVFRRFGALPVNYYSVCFNPLAVPAEEPCTGDLADDLADIWRDVKRGLSFFDSGHIDTAVFEWRENFNIHWGRHAASALYILQCWTIESGGNEGPKGGKAKRLPPNETFPHVPLVCLTIAAIASRVEPTSSR